MDNLRELLNKRVREIGYSSITEYSHSKLFNLIAEEILKRDEYKCKSRTCRNTANGISFVEFHLPALLGICTGLIYSMCKDCRTWCRGENLELKHVSNRVLFKVAGIRKLNGVNDDKIGYFYKERFEFGTKLNRKIYKRLKKELPDVYATINHMLTVKVIPETYYYQLGLKEKPNDRSNLPLASKS